MILSFNRPKLCPTVKWNPAGFRLPALLPKDYIFSILFIDKNNTIYTGAEEDGKILVWPKDSTHPMSSINYQSELKSASLFVSNNGDIYLSTMHKIILRWTASQNVFVHFMNTKEGCISLFIDLHNNIYCSMMLAHQVVKKSRSENDTVETTIVAGTGGVGRGETQLTSPRGIFVDTNLDLYVADWYNHRIQLFQFNEVKGKTVAGEFSYEITILLRLPTSVALDCEKYLFIAEAGFDRIIGSGPNGFRCLLGCNREEKKVSQLKWPLSFHFDMNGNLFVNDAINTRIQKFHLNKDSCGNVPSTIQAIYSSTLTHDHERFSRELYNSSEAYYYEVIEVNVSKSDFYILTGDSSIGLYGFIYKDHFHRFDPLKDLIAWCGKPDYKDQFKFTLELQMNTKYILVVTTYYRNVTGPFSIIIFGSNIVHLQRMNIEPVIQSTYRSALTQNHRTYFRDPCQRLNKVNYEAIQVNVTENGFYTFLSRGDGVKGLPTITSYIYEHDFYPSIPFGNLISEEDKSCSRNGDIITVRLMPNIQYVLVVTTCNSNVTTDFIVQVSGRSAVSLERVDPSPDIHRNYSSNLTINSQTYAKDCTNSQYYYETIRMTVSKNGYYTLLTGGYYTLSPGEYNATVTFMYENQFDPLNPRKKKLTSIMYHECIGKIRDEFTAKLQANTTYILVITTLKPRTSIAFSIVIYGSANFTFERFIDDSTDCYIGDPCNPQVNSIGLTLDDILRAAVKQNITIHNQPFGIKMSAAVTIIMFIAGIISCLCSIITFQNETLRKVGCGLYLLASSITSFLTITMFTIKFWFVLVTQMNTNIHLSIHQGGCKSIETLLKFFFYWDAWLNACVAVERGINVYQGINFNKEKSKRFARWILLILPFVIIVSIIHEPLYRQVLDYDKKEKSLYVAYVDTPEEFVTSRDIWCQTSYSQSVRDYNTFILFIHLLGPFIANLSSALFIITGTARRRAEAQKRHTFKEHIREQWKEHKQLVISPTILFVLTTPRLIISLLPTCLKISDYIWLYLSAYFISFLPSILIFIIFVIPSTLYRNTFKESIARARICGKQRSSTTLEG
ncbi:unnamed protein product [Adineta ricciae]|uniref:G-protein coupled receptors family 1 profile domain-containing protein n=1 Tax=Adineta ricciae TaxID=249248 RepID=A0A814BEJ3_ADIRI|nr:unnamed protein product [Adineta ricciae]